VKRMVCAAVLFAAVLLVMGGCGKKQALDPNLSSAQGAFGTEPSLNGEVSAGSEMSENSLPDGTLEQAESLDTGSTGDGTIDRSKALSVALENAGVPEKDAYNVKAERDRENGIPIFRVEFETDYGDYDFEISISDGWIVGADYEVDEEWLDRLGGAPVTPEEAKNIVRSKVPGSEAGDVRIRKEGGDGRGRFEGELFYAGMKYEFEMDPNTGIIFDWNADLRE